MSIYKRNNRLSPEYVLLGFLHDRPSHGYELNQRLVDEFGYIWRVSQSQTYNILHRIESQGYIISNVIGQEKLPSRQLFRLTEAGSAHFNTWLETPTSCSVHAIRVEFITRLFFIHQFYPNRTQETIRLQLDEVHSGIERLQELRQDLPSDQQFNRLALDLRINLLSSIISWLNDCRHTFVADKPEENGQK